MPSVLNGIQFHVGPFGREPATTGEQEGTHTCCWTIVVKVDAVGHKGVARAVHSKHWRVPPDLRRFHTSCEADGCFQCRLRQGIHGVQNGLGPSGRTGGNDAGGKARAKCFNSCHQVFCCPTDGFPFVRNADIAVKPLAHLPKPVFDAHYGYAPRCQSCAVGLVRRSVAAACKKSASVQKHNAPTGMNHLVWQVQVTA